MPANACPDIFRPELTRVYSAGDAAGLRAIKIHLHELPRHKINLSTDIGNYEASGHASALLRNVFGGGESLALDASTGTRTRKSYSARLLKPLPWLAPAAASRAELYANAVTANMPWAACDEFSRSVGGEMVWGGAVPVAIDEMVGGPGLVFGARHRLGIASVWRQVTGLERDASMAVRREAGDSVKNAIRYSFHLDRRDQPRLPTTGGLVKAAMEVAGFGPLGGDVGFAKGELELGGAMPISLPRSLFSLSSPPSSFPALVCLLYTSPSPRDS